MPPQVQVNSAGDPVLIWCSRNSRGCTTNLSVLRLGSLGRRIRKAVESLEILHREVAVRFSDLLGPKEVPFVESELGIFSRELELNVFSPRVIRGLRQL